MIVMIVTASAERPGLGAAAGYMAEILGER
jgi:hypothetical protein